MSSTPRRRPRLAVGCALAVLACALAGPAFADPAPSYTDLLARLDQTPAAAESGALVDAAGAHSSHVALLATPAPDALRAAAHHPADSLRETANSHFGLLRQATHSQNDRRKLTKALLLRGRTVDYSMTRVFKGAE